MVATSQNVSELLDEEATRQQGVCEKIFLRKLGSFCPEVPEEQRQHMAMTLALARVTKDEDILNSTKAVIESATNLIITLKQMKTVQEKARTGVRFKRMIEEGYEEFDQLCMDNIADKIVDPMKLVAHSPYNKTTLH
jgi:hypothetical protein